MRKLMRLDKAIEKKIVKNLDNIDPNALFPKNPNKVTLDPIYTGVLKKQEIYRPDFDYVFFKTRVKRDIKLSILAIGKEENKNASVSLRGKIGYIWDSHCFRVINKLYSNRDNGITADSLSEKEYKLLLERNKKFKGFKFATWIDASFEERVPVEECKAITKGGLKFARGTMIHKQVLWYSSGHILTEKFDYCPYIHIWGPEDIMVVLNSKKKDGKWKLIPRKGLLKWWYRLF